MHWQQASKWQAALLTEPWLSKDGCVQRNPMHSHNSVVSSNDLAMQCLTVQCVVRDRSRTWTGASATLPAAWRRRGLRQRSLCPQQHRCAALQNRRFQPHILDSELTPGPAVREARINE